MAPTFGHFRNSRQTIDPDCYPKLALKVCFSPQISHKTIYKAPDTALRISAREETLAEMRNAVSGAL
jgi:hypothetical protein